MMKQSNAEIQGNATTRELKRVERLATIEVKLDNLIAQVSKLENGLVVRVTDHEKRLNRIERVIWAIAGIFLLFIVPILLFVFYRVAEHFF